MKINEPEKGIDYYHLPWLLPLTSIKQSSQQGDQKSLETFSAWLLKAQYYLMKQLNEKKVYKKLCVKITYLKSNLSKIGIHNLF